MPPYAATPLEPAETFPELASTADTLSNGILTLRFDDTGAIVSCLDRDGAEHAADGLNRLVVHKDPYVWPFNAWDIKADYVNTAPRVLASDATWRPSVDGAVAVRRQVYRGRTVTIDQRVVLEAGSDVVRFETEVDWHERHRMLRAEFRPTHYGESVRCEIQFGHIERVTTERDAVEKAQFEVCAHKWIATEDAGGGFALLNDGKYGHRAKNGLLSLNLLRAPTFPDKTADRGIHRFTYAFCPFDDGDLAKVVREGYRLNNPLRITEGVGFESVGSRRRRGRDHRDREAGRARRRGGAAALREPGTPDHDGAPGRPASPHRATRPTFSSGPPGKQISSDSCSARSRSRRSCWRIES